MTYDQIRTPADLRRFVEAGRDSKFFERSTMKFFGDTMQNYGVRRVAEITSAGGDRHTDVVELYRRRPVKHGLSSSAYFVQDEHGAARRVIV